MGFLTPFIIGAVVGVAGSWSYQRRKSNAKSAYSSPPTGASTAQPAASSDAAVQEDANGAGEASEAAPAE